MTYNDFTTQTVRQTFKVRLFDQAFFPSNPRLEPSPWLKETLEKGSSLFNLGDKAKNEFYIAPMLLECRERFQRRVQIFSGHLMDVDAASGLAGRVDYLLTFGGNRYDTSMPAMIVRQAVKCDLVNNLGPCIAQMVAASRVAEKAKKPVPFVYGCVTSGESWLFMKLLDGEVQIDPRLIQLGDVNALLGYLMECLHDFGRQLTDEPMIVSSLASTSPATLSER